MFATFFTNTAIGRWLASKVAALGITTLLALCVVGAYFYHQYTVSSLKKDNAELRTDIGVKQERITELEGRVKQLNEQIELKKQSDKAADVISIGEQERKQVVDASTKDSVDRIHRALKPKQPSAPVIGGLAGVAKPLKIDTATPGTQDVDVLAVGPSTPIYEDPSSVVIDELWIGYCTDLHGIAAECQKPTEKT